jgi:hypothetical protein
LCIHGSPYQETPLEQEHAAPPGLLECGEKKWVNLSLSGNAARTENVFGSGDPHEREKHCSNKIQNLKFKIPPTMRRQNDQSLGELLKEWLANSSIRHRVYQYRIETIWKEKMGTTINQYTTEIKVVRNKVYLHIASASLRQEMAFSREKIRDMLNEELGERFVEEVIVG